MDNEKKQILIIGPGMEIGGVERSLIGLLDAIDYDKYDVDLFLYSHSGEFMPFINKKVNLLPENKLYSLSTLGIAELIKKGHLVVGVIRIFAKFGGDLLGRLHKSSTVNMDLCKRILTGFIPKNSKHYDLGLGFFGPFYYLNRNINADRKIGWVHTDYSNQNENPYTNYYEAEYKKLNYIACVSEDVKQSFDKVYSNLKDKTIVIENILSKEFVQNQAGEFVPIGELPDDGSIKLLSVGRFDYAKGFDDAVKACKALVDEGYNIKWYLIGYGPGEELIRQTIQDVNIADNFIILGKKSNPYPYMKRCDIYVQPSRYEGKAVTVREAQMLGKPVLITRYQTSASQLEEGVDGYICDLSVEGIVSGVEYMVSHPEYAEMLSQNCKQRDYSNSTNFKIEDFLNKE